MRTMKESAAKYCWFQVLAYFIEIMLTFFSHPLNAAIFGGDSVSSVETYLQLRRVSRCHCSRSFKLLFSNRNFCAFLLQCILSCRIIRAIQLCDYWSIVKIVFQSFLQQIDQRSIMTIFRQLCEADFCDSPLNRNTMILFLLFFFMSWFCCFRTFHFAVQFRVLLSPIFRILSNRLCCEVFLLGPNYRPEYQTLH